MQACGHVFEAELPRENKLVFDYPGIVKLGKTIGVFIQVVIAFEEQLVFPFPAGIVAADQVEVQGRYRVFQDVVFDGQGVVAAYERAAGVLQRQQVRKATENRGRSDHADAFAFEFPRLPGNQACRERIQIGEPVSVQVEFLVGNSPVAIAIERRRRTGDVSAMIDQLLCQPVPAGNLIAFVLVPHAAELGAHRIR